MQRLYCLIFCMLIGLLGCSDSLDPDGTLREAELMAQIGEKPYTISKIALYDDSNALLVGER